MRRLRQLVQKVPSPSFKYIFSYIIVATVPLIIISLFSFQFFIQEYRGEVLANRASSLQMVRNSFEMLLTQMENTVKQIELEDDLLRYDIENDMMTTIRLRNRLIKYQLTSGYLRDILFYLRGSDFICASSSTYRFDNYANVVNSMSALTPEQFEAYFRQSTSRRVFPPQTEKPLGASQVETASFLYPLPYNDIAPYATVLFKIEMRHLRAVCGLDGGDDVYAIVVENEDGPVFLTSRAAEDGLRESWERAVQLGEQGSFLENTNGENTMVSYLRDPLRGVTYLCRTPEHLALSKVESIRNLFLLLILLLVALEMGFTFLVGYNNYRPIKSLREYLEANFTQVPDQEGEIQAVRHVLADMLERHELLNEKLSLSADTLREVILYKLINGGFTSREELGLSAGGSGVALTRPFLRIAIYQPGDGAPQPDAAELCGLFRACLDSEECYCCTFSGRIVFVLAGDLSAGQEVRRRFDRLQDRLSESGGKPYFIGVGDVQQDIARLHLSYIQAAAAMDYRFISGSNNVIFYTDILSDKELYDFYPAEEIGEVRASIREGNAERFCYLIDEVLALLRRRGSNLIFARLVSYDVVNTVIQSVLEVSKGSSDISERAPDILLLGSMHDVGELTSAIAGVRDEALTHLERRGSNPFIEQVLAVIDENIENYSFTVRELAERFHVSQNSLSQRFKRAMNVTPIEYINQRKLERAKLYLSGTDLSIRAIVEQLGYTNESSFIRKFKAAVGVTPGEYRKKMNLHRK